MAHLDFELPIVALETKIRELRDLGADDVALSVEVQRLEQRAVQLRKQIYAGLSVWQRVQLSRHPERPHFVDYLGRIFTDFVELHGDRRFGDDRAIIAGFAKFEGRSVAVIGQEKGRITKERLHRNFGMPNPEGYRKAMRVMELAARYRRPVFTFIDTPGAYPGLGAEERGQSEAIGESILVMSQLDVPTVATVIGEGGSGGALALGVASRVNMLEFATYSVITPEGCASILWRDGARAPDAAEALKLLAAEAKSFGLVDDVIDEPVGGAHRDVALSAEIVRASLRSSLASLETLGASALVEQRYAKFRKMGVYGMAADDFGP
jgi:acetyl-CoA carboxylase carboxyl transferase subunit alpha